MLTTKIEILYDHEFEELCESLMIEKNGKNNNQDGSMSPVHHPCDDVIGYLRPEDHERIS